MTLSVDTMFINNTVNELFLAVNLAFKCSVQSPHWVFEETSSIHSICYITVEGVCGQNCGWQLGDHLEEYLFDIGDWNRSWHSGVGQ
jgi:hypothetical protein